MKKAVLSAIIFLIVPLLLKAQITGTLERVPLITLDGYYSVRNGEFQAKTALESYTEISVNGVCYQLLYIATNESSGLSNVYLNGHPKWFQRFVVRPFLTTDEWKTGIFVIKYLDKDQPSIGYGMETVYARNIRQELCDSVVSVGDDGFVYKIGKKYYYTKYRETNTLSQPIQIVWPEKKVFVKEEDASLLPKEDTDRFTDGDVFHYCFWDDESRALNYYYLYRDEYMPYTVLVIDGRPVELFGVYTDEKFRLKYSFNGEHWMAVADQCFWVDGQAKKLDGFQISDFFVNDEGDYFYKATRIGEEKKGETIVANGVIIRKDAYVGYFNLNAAQKLTFHFFSNNGQCFVYEDGQIANKTEEYRTFFYEDDRIDGMNVKLTSNGKHTLEFVTGQGGVTIDGERKVGSVPFQVYYDSKRGYFRWNSIESNREGKTDLVIYKYHLKF